MDGDNIIPIPQIPEELRSAVIRHIRQFAVTMVVCGEDESQGLPCGGVLCTVAGKSGILTARHVWDELRRARKLLLMLGPKHPIRIDREHLDAFAPPSTQAAELNDAAVPDIAFISLSGKDKSSVEALHKSFYSIDRRRKDPSKFDLFGDSGFWVAIGSPVELLQRGSGTVASFSFVTDIDRRVTHESWDYLFVNMNLESNAAVPPNLEGMSGGGIWRTRLWATPDRRRFTVPNLVDDVLLQGITFLQTAQEGRQLVAHGPKSIYRRMPDLMEAGNDAR